MTERRKAGKTAASEKPRKAADSKAGPRLEDRTRLELYEMAHRLEIAGSADMTKAELVEAIRRR